MKIKRVEHIAIAVDSTSVYWTDAPTFSNGRTGALMKETMSCACQ